MLTVNPGTLSLQWSRHLAMTEGAQLYPDPRRFDLLQWSRHLAMTEGGRWQIGSATSLPSFNGAAISR